MVQDANNTNKITDTAFTGDGTIINSDFLNGLSVENAKEKIVNYLELRGIGSKKTNYKLKDWGVSRQRYWGCPIPILYRKTEKQFSQQTRSSGDPPKDISSRGLTSLRDAKEWQLAKCPETGMKALRETDTFDTF